MKICSLLNIFDFKKEFVPHFSTRTPGKYLRSGVRFRETDLGPTVEGKEIIGYLRLPKNASAPVPLVIAVNGLDSRKEDLSESFAAILPFGIGFLAVDGPGTGESPIKVSENADRMLSHVIDYVQTRPEVDKGRLAVHGVSWGGYWATKLAIVERSRLKGASAQSPPTDEFFQKNFLMHSLSGNREYLFD